MSVHNWPLGVQLQDAMDRASECKVYVNNHLCPICNASRTSAKHKSMSGRCAKIMQKRANNENNNS